MEQLLEIPSLLRQMRGRLDPATPMLGEHRRLNTRRGKAVSQEELAEAIGVSRGWYVCLELGTKRPSIPLLDRLATALNASQDERANLFRLAIPGLQQCLAAASRCPRCDTYLQ
jgi:DNA-binding XRE family transcriptional regulator